MRRAAILTLLLSIAGSRASFADQVIYSEKSLYRNIYVSEDGDLICMRFLLRNGGRQSCRDVRSPKHLVFNYTKMMMGALYLSPELPKNVLILGLGGGTLPKAVRLAAPDAEITAVEIDPAVLKVAERFFEYKPDAHMETVISDGRVFVRKMQREGRRFDLIMLDAYDQEYIPEHMLTREFLTEVSSLLTDDGVLAANTFTSSRLYSHESTTYRAVFGPFYNLRTENRVILLKKGGLPPMEFVAARAEALDPLLRPMDVRQDWMLDMFSTEQNWDTAARVLTDDYSPSNLLNGPAR